MDMGKIHASVIRKLKNNFCIILAENVFVNLFIPFIGVRKGRQLWQECVKCAGRENSMAAT
jgi:hypothetical protein